MTIKTNTSEPAAAGNHDTSSTLSELIRLAMQHVDFLRKLHSMGVTLKQPCSESFRRYKDLWLPLIAKSYESERIVRNQLAPPPDIAWLWHCHRLAPAKYEEYIRQEFAGSTNKKTNAESILDLCDPQAPFEMTLPGTSKVVCERCMERKLSERAILPPRAGGSSGCCANGSTLSTTLWI
jgi:hypothetical protein